jgi:CBS domain
MAVETILRQKGTDVATIEPEASIRRAADWLRVKNIGALVVTSGRAVLGLISEREIVHAFSRYGETAASMSVKEIMRYGVITVSPDERKHLWSPRRRQRRAREEDRGEQFWQHHFGSCSSLRDAPGRARMIRSPEWPARSLPPRIMSTYASAW